MEKENLLAKTRQELEDLQEYKVRLIIFLLELFITFCAWGLLYCNAHTIVVCIFDPFTYMLFVIHMYTRLFNY